MEARDVAIRLLGANIEGIFRKWLETSQSIILNDNN
jgi:hypothetical protein